VTTFLVRRLLQAVPTMLLVSLIVFAIMRATPGDPARAVLGNAYGVTEQVLANVRRQMGLDQPLYVQYLIWLGDLVHGNLGRSYISQAQVGDLLKQTVPASFELAFAASLLALVVALPAGVLIAIKRGTVLDHVVTALVTAGIAMPGFWLAMLLVILFAVVMPILPPSGYIPFSEDPLGHLQRLILPTVTLAILVASPTMRFVRSSMLDVLGEEYLRSARAKGLGEWLVITRHALKNALIPAVTWIGLQFAYLVASSVMIEWVFGWPGVGALAVRAVMSRDYIVVQGTVVFAAAVFVVVNLLVDVLYVVLDPRVRQT
jgi:peptide/nickel transport system permease protein